jgi:hypothetical protein
VKSILFLFFGGGGGIGLFLVCLTVEKNAGMPENYRCLIDYDYQEKKKEIDELKYIVFEIYHYLLDFTEYFLSVNKYQLRYKKNVLKKHNFGMGGGGIFKKTHKSNHETGFVDFLKVLSKYIRNVRKEIGFLICISHRHLTS